MKMNLPEKKVKWNAGGIYQVLHLSRSSTINLTYGSGAVIQKTCKIVEFINPADVNKTKKTQEKEDNYGPLIYMLQVIYLEYRFSLISVIVGAMGTIPLLL